MNWQYVYFKPPPVAAQALTGRPTNKQTGKPTYQQAANHYTTIAAVFRIDAPVPPCSRATADAMRSCAASVYKLFRPRVPMELGTGNVTCGWTNSNQNR